MGRFFYTHFGDDVPKYIEQEYNRLRRREQWLEEKDAQNGLVDVDFDTVLAYLPDESTNPLSDECLAEQERKKAVDQARLDYLPVALELLRLEYPSEYAMLHEYYFSEEKVTMAHLAKKYQTSKQAVHKKIDTARQILKDYILVHESDKF